jgi:transposase
MKQDKTKIRRVFSEAFKRQKVQELQQNRIKVSDICNQYGVSGVSVYRWLRLYATTYHPPTRMVVELESETIRTKQLEQRVAELERLVGQKQIALDFSDAIIAVASKEFGIDLRSDFFSKVSITYNSKAEHTI